MISPDIMTIPAAGQDLYGKTVGELIGSDVAVSEDGTVTGIFHYVTGYTGFNSAEVEEQSGYYFPFTLEKTGEKMSFLKNGEPSKTDIAWEANNVFRVTAGDTFTIKVDGQDVITLNFSQASFESAKARRSKRLTQ